jgi:hypothetical protein
MSSNISGPLGDMPDGTTNPTKVANIYLPAGERSEMMPIYISGFRDSRAFLAWFRASFQVV